MVPLPLEQSGRIHCQYMNTTRQVQITRISDVANGYFERVVFPGQCLLFTALPSARLEIHTYTHPSAILSDTVPCDRLCINEASPSIISGVNPQQVRQFNGSNRKSASRNSCLANARQSVCSRS